jgi:hypothetical protein
MKRVLLIYNIFSDDESFKGVFKKMLEQNRSLSRMGATVDMINLHSKGIQSDGRLIMAKDLYKPSSRDSFQIYDFYKEIKNIDNLGDYEVFYIRYSPYTLGLLSLLKHLKKIKPNCKIYLDLPLYPFANEYHGMKKLMMQLVSYRLKKLKNYVDNIVSSSDRKEIWGIPVVHIKNAIDPESYKLRKAHRVDKVIRLIMTTTYWDWQGVDRLVQGMISYHKRQDKAYTFYLTLVGEGPELSNITAIAEDAAVREHIFFYTTPSSAEVNQFFDQADIAIGTLAVDRQNKEECPALIHREYGARGIPFIYAGKDNSFDGKDFVLNVPLQEGETSFDHIVDFYETLSESPAIFTPESIREQVRQDLSWQSQLGFLIGE